jgi:primosomal protein N' (replication factor Y)
MYMRVRLLNGFSQQLVYAIPSEWSLNDLVGSLVRVPLQKRSVTALVEEITQQKPSVSFEIKAALAIEALPADPLYRSFINEIASYYHVRSTYLLKRLQLFMAQKETVVPMPSETPEALQIKEICLTQEQEDALRTFKARALESTYFATLLHGVTGSGKTEIYKKIIEHYNSLEKTVLFLLPEVSLAVRFQHILKAQLPETIALYSFHSATAKKEKKALWQALLAEKPLVLIGVHLPILLPLPRLGCIIIDEEHDAGFQEKKHPRINTKEAAIRRAHMYGIPIVLGSATPALSSLYNVEHRGWLKLSLSKRYTGSFPQVCVERLQEGLPRPCFWITKRLQQAIAQRLERKEQVIIFINRRGYSFFVQCKECGLIATCAHCSVSLTLHETGMLHCHYCEYSCKVPETCTQCAASKDKLLKKGIGTQQAVALLKELFPQARIARADQDATVQKKKWQEMVRAMLAGELDILVGTQTVTKGYHFPQVTLVGVLWADLQFNFPLYNAGEMALAQLIQVAGRAGRYHANSEVIIQTIGEHRLFDYLSEEQYPHFYTDEMALRQLVGYPPYVRLLEIELKHTNEEVLERESAEFAQQLRYLITSSNYAVQVLGPARPPIHKIKNWHTRKMYLKAKNMELLLHLLKSIGRTQFTSFIYATPNPIS